MKPMRILCEVQSKVLVELLTLGGLILLVFSQMLPEATASYISIVDQHGWQRNAAPMGVFILLLWVGVTYYVLLMVCCVRILWERLS